MYIVPAEIAARYPYSLPSVPAKGPHPARGDDILVKTPYTGPSKRVTKRRAARGRKVRKYND